MRSWILRHRLRLRLIYGPGLDPAELSVVGSPAAAGPGGDPLDPLGHEAPGARTPGRMRRSEDGLELVPMPPRVGRSRRVG